MIQNETVIEAAPGRNISFASIGLPIVIVVFVIFNCIVTPNFFDTGALYNLIVQSFPVIIIGMGVTAVIATGGIDISVGSVMALTACLTAYLMITLELSIFMSVFVGIAVGLGVGMANGFFISVFHIQPTIMTLIMMIIARGIGQQISNGLFISMYNTPWVTIVKTRLFGFLPMQLIVIVIAVLIFWFLFSRHTLGKHIQAVGDNAQAARLSGISPVKALIFVYAITGALAAFVGIIESARATVADPTSLGTLIEMDIIAAVTIGGTPMTGGKANVAGTVLGALLITLITMSVNMNNIPYYYAYIIKGAIIIFALYLNMRNSNNRKG